MALDVQSGYIGAMEIAIDAGAGSPTLVILGIKTGNARETIEKHDLTSTASPIVSSPNNPGQPVVQVPRINGKASLRLSTTAQYAAGGTGDPPDFSGGKIYGNHSVSYQAGDTITGSFLMENYANMLNVDGTIDYAMDLINNGAYSRSTGP